MNMSVFVSLYRKSKPPVVKDRFFVKLRSCPNCALAFLISTIYRSQIHSFKFHRLSALMAKLVLQTDYCVAFSAFPMLFIVRTYPYWLNRFLLFQRTPFRSFPVISISAEIVWHRFTKTVFSIKSALIAIIWHRHINLNHFNFTFVPHSTQLTTAL